MDEFLAKAKMGRCSSFREAAEVIGRQAFPMFLNVTANVTNWSSDGNECSLVRQGLQEGGKFMWWQDSIEWAVTFRGCSVILVSSILLPLSEGGS